MDVVDVYRGVAVDVDEDVGVMCVISTIYLCACVARGGARGSPSVLPPRCGCM
jgi:hypothetical protein